MEYLIAPAGDFCHAQLQNEITVIFDEHLYQVYTDFNSDELMSASILLPNLLEITLSEILVFT